MSTTSLFVELIVIGVGVLLWLLLLAASIFGFSWPAEFDAVILVAAVPVLAVVYVLGIIWDRISDWIFQRLWADDLRSAYFDDLSAYYNARRTIITGSEPLSNLLEYGRSRLRICRGWTLNALAGAVALNVLVWTGAPDDFAISRGLLSALGTGFLVALSCGSWFAWRSLAAAEYRKISQQSVYLRADNTAGDRS